MAMLTDEQKEELRESVEDVRKGAEDVAKKVSKRAKPAVDAAKKATKPAADAVKKATKPAADAVEDMAKKVAKKAVMKPEVYVQFSNKEVLTQDLVAQAKALYKDAGNRAAIRSLRVYLKPEDSKAYVVINDEFNAEIHL
jgi:uncharacterized protein YutE (UPF0331/DUF86 family)